MASFIRICEGEKLETKANATSQAFYVIRGSGSTTSEHGTINWDTGDLFVVPVCEYVRDVARVREGGKRWGGVVLGARRAIDGLFRGHAE